MTLLQGSKSRKKTNFVLTNRAFFYRSTLKKTLFLQSKSILTKAENAWQG